MNKAYYSRHPPFTALLAMFFCLSQLPQACMAASHAAHGHQPISKQPRSTFLYGVTNPLIGSRVNENKLNITVFRLRRNGKFAMIPLRYNPKAFETGYAGTVNGLTASPDGRFLVMECNNTDDGSYRPYFLQYRIRPDGQLTPHERFGLEIGARNIVFAPSGRYAYATLPDLSISQSLPGKVLEFHVSVQGDIVGPPFASVPCGPMPTALTLDSQGKVGAVLDAETGFLWQYTLTPQGKLLPANPPSVAVCKTPLAPLVTAQRQFMYVINDGSLNRHRIYQLHRNSSGGFSLLMPEAVRLSGVIWSVAISNKHHVIYVSSGNRLLTFRISPQGTLQPGPFSLNSTAGLSIVSDELKNCLYILGLHNTLRAYRIGQDGRLTVLNQQPAYTNLRLNDLTVVHH